MIKAVIMAGGSGTRLWPISRSGHPKQFLPIYNHKTMLQNTYERIQNLDISSTTFICNKKHRFFVKDQIRDIGKDNKIIVEPEGKNTAPAVALAAFSYEDDPIILVLSSDHCIKDQDGFVDIVRKSIPLAEDGKLVTFGIKPSSPNINYGYIEAGEQYKNGFHVKKFKEKPLLDLAKKYVKSDKFFWNSGIFLFKKSQYLAELEKFRPDIYKICDEAFNDANKDSNFIHINPDLFSTCPSESIDYAVMENTNQSVMVEMSNDWSDAGTWNSLWDIGNKDNNGNVSDGDIIIKDSSNCYIRSEDKLTSVIGVSDLIIVNTKDALMIVSKDKIHDVTNLVKDLRDNSRTEWEWHREVVRPWGKYDSVDSGEGFQVKRITVKPGEKLSVQMHYHRSEHWIVVSGIARVHYGKNSKDLNVNESTYHDKEVIHALENPGKIDLELIEVQIGDYLGEDDIVRYEDIYGRDE
tara:strand:+ start:1132 stop:2526 length:1395 start_codon:yes stop_codon:yes gene_type:complete